MSVCYHNHAIYKHGYMYLTNNEIKTQGWQYLFPKQEFFANAVLF